MVQTVEKTPDVHIVRRRFTPGEYHRMAEIGLCDGERVELIEGEVVKMSPIGLRISVHAPGVFVSSAVVGRCVLCANAVTVEFGGE
ncbi:MAG: hypothetical protein ACUVSV_07075 [Armatimonadota bacterium]